jgi:hypothetical protein
VQYKKTFRSGIIWLLSFAVERESHAVKGEIATIIVTEGSEMWIANNFSNRA